MLSWSRGLFLLWLVGTAVWMSLWAVLVTMSCHRLPNRRLDCQAISQSFFGPWVEKHSWDYGELALVGFSLPLGVLVLLTIVSAVAAGRRRR